MFILTGFTYEITFPVIVPFSNAPREQELGRCKPLINAPAPSLDFDGEGPSWKEAQEVVRKKRASSASGPCGQVDQNVFKNLKHVLTISLLGDEGNVFFCAATNDLLSNIYINTELPSYHSQVLGTYSELLL